MQNLVNKWFILEIKESNIINYEVELILINERLYGETSP